MGGWFSFEEGHTRHVLPLRFRASLVRSAGACREAGPKGVGGSWQGVWTAHPLAESLSLPEGRAPGWPLGTLVL